MQFQTLARWGGAVVSIFILTFLALGCASASSGSAESGMIGGGDGNGAENNTTLLRVRVLENQSQVQLTAKESPRIRTSSNPASRTLRMNPGSTYTITLSPASGWMIGTTSLGSGQLVISAESDGSISINKARYRGEYRLVPTSATTFDVVNDVNVEAYLKGVVTREMLHNWHPQALRAQAIIARTYALYEARHAPVGEQWNLFADNRSQVYGGMDSETPEAIAAVQDTTGIVVAFGPPGQERIFKAYFSACCGGATQSPTAVSGFDIPPMMPRTTGGLCSISPKYQWQTAPISKDELTRRIKAWAARINRSEQYMEKLDRIDIQAINAAGRPTQFTLTDTRGKRYTLVSEDFRHSINSGMKPTLLYSSFVTITNAPATIQFSGRGSGHGVGMCQWCCQAMALQGYGHESIVLWQYPGAKLIRAY